MVNIQDLLVSGVHLGHKFKNRNPKMAPYVYANRFGIQIIDLVQTLVCLRKACNFLSQATSSGKKVLFVCTNRPFRSIIENYALSSNSYYINYRWLGGTLTNWNTIEGCVNKLKDLTKQELDGTFDRLTKKESLGLKKKKDRLEKYFSGIKDMNKVPDIVILVGQDRELKAARECLKLGITLISILDTNCDPTLTDFVIPANDDSFRSVSIILKALVDSINKTI